MATIRDVAKLAGVSVATVSRVLNQNGYVNKDTEDKIRESMEKLNYKPNTLARALSNKKTDMIALIIPDITNPFFPELARAVEDTAKRLGYSLILGNSYSVGENEMEYIEVLKSRYVDGIIFATHKLHSREIEELYRLNIPVVNISRVENSYDTSITVNNYEGACLATRHLASIGCKRIAHISGPSHIITSKDRLEGYIDTLRQLNMYNPSYLVEGDFSIESGIQMTGELLEKHPDIDGIFAANDLIAIGALKSLINRGKKVPDDIALIGFDGIELTAVMEPEISTIAQPIYEMGEQAVIQLVAQIEKRETARGNVQYLEAKLIQRASTTRKIIPK